MIRLGAQFIMFMVNKSDKILITGATGFIGSYITRKLIQSGYSSLYGLCRKTSNFDLLDHMEDQVQWHVGDLLDIHALEEIVQKVDHVIHAAAVVSFDSNVKDVMELTNVEGTTNLVNVALDAKIKKFVHLSSIAALGKSRPEDRIQENSPWVHSKYNSVYAKSKKESEIQVWRGQAEGLQVTVLNPSVVLGAGKWSNSSVRIFGNMDRKQKFYPLGSNGFVDVRDVAIAVEKVLQENHIGKKYLLNAEHWSYKDFMDKVSKIYGVHTPKFPISKAIIPIAWRVMSVYSKILRKPGVYTKSTVINSSKDWVYDNTHSVESLGMQYSSIDRCITQTSELFLESKARDQDFGILSFA